MTLNGYRFAYVVLWLLTNVFLSHAAWLHRPHHQSVYYFSDETKKYDNAKSACNNINAKLVTIQSGTENGYIAGSNVAAGDYWIGLHCDRCDSLSALSWHSGETNTYRNWDSGTFIVGNKRRVYAYIKFSSNNKWGIGRDADEQMPYICEKRDGCTINGDPCLNGGTCSVDDSDGYTCACTAGYTGRSCESDINECTEGTDDCAPSQSDCVNDIGGFTCNCHPGYTGQRCQTDIDECELNYCQNGATCTNAPGTYDCQCPSGYTGQNCTTDVNECLSNPCFNGGTCQNQQNRFTCACPATFNGTQCEIDVNECLEMDIDCGNGTCSNTHGGFSCVCPAGIQGDNCSQDINECLNENQCNSHGNCTNYYGGFKCKCEDGFDPHTNCSKNDKHSGSGEDILEDLTPYRNAFTASAVLCSIAFIVFMALLVEDRIHSYRMTKRKASQSSVNNSAEPQPSTSADTVAYSADSQEAKCVDNTFVDLCASNTKPSVLA